MTSNLLETLRQWNKDNDSRAKLQHAYFIAVIGLVITAGLFSLLNVEFGRQILAFTAVIGAVFIVNAVAWSLLQTFILLRLGATRRPTKKQ